MSEPTPPRPIAQPSAAQSTGADRPVPQTVADTARPGLLRRLLPRPWTALWLWLTWLLLNQTTEPGHLLLGAVLALALAGWLPTPVRAASGRPRGAWRRPGAFAWLVTIVTWDIVVANMQVAARILGLTGELKPRFVWVPIELKQPNAITLLACIITMTPGTLSSELSDDRTHLLVHGLDVDDPDALVAQIKARYETPIRELFE